MRKQMAHNTFSKRRGSVFPSQFIDYRSRRLIEYRSSKLYFEILPSERKENKRESDIKKRIVEKILGIDQKNYPADMKPSKETVDRAVRLIEKVYSDLRLIGTEMPSVAASENNSIDVFWGDRQKRLLVNVPSDKDEPILAHMIDGDEASLTQFTDGRYSDLSHLIKEMRDHAWR